MKFEHKVVPVVETKVIDEDQGIVGAFVSVTGVVDSVKDRIIPGAYEKTLKARTPKGVFSHDWDQPVARTLNAEELLPGDDRLPTKVRSGEEWPAMAGALYVEAQFNLETQRGREAFSDVKFYGSDAEWSIGYNVPPGASRVDSKTGVRELSYIDLYEYSPVLFGAMPLTQTAGFKDAQEAFRAAVKAGDATPDMVVEEEREEVKEATDSGDTVPLIPVAQGFTEATEDTPVTTPADPIHQVTPGHTGDQAGVDVEPRPDPEALVNPDPATEAPKAAEFMVGVNEKGRDALAEVTAWFKGEAAKDGADLDALGDEALSRVSAILEDRENTDVKAVDVEEGKAMVTLTGSYEERQMALRRQAATVTDGFDLDQTDEWGYPRYYLGVEATFNNRVVYAAYDMMDEDPVRYFEASYAFDGSQATLKNPREVRVEAAVAAKGAERQAGLVKARAKAHEIVVGDVLVPTAAPVPPQGDEKASTGEDGVDTAPEGEATTVTLSEADLLLLDRLKLDA